MASIVVVLLDKNTQPSTPSPALIVDRNASGRPLCCCSRKAALSGMAPALSL
jgi:hypothetical protein